TLLKVLLLSILIFTSPRLLSTFLVLPLILVFLLPMFRSPVLTFLLPLLMSLSPLLGFLSLLSFRVPELLPPKFRSDDVIEGRLADFWLPPLILCRVPPPA